jgi:flagellar hook protein FlgE
MKLVSWPFYLLSLLTNSIKKTCDTVPQLTEKWSLPMTVQVTERDESKMSHEGLAAGVRIWDVHQQGQLVGMFHNEHEAHLYRVELEDLESQRATQ